MPWLLLRLVHFLNFGDISGSEGIWVEEGAWLIRIGGEGWVFWGFCQGSPRFGPYIPLGLVHFEVLGDILGSGGVWNKGGGCLV